MLTLLTGKAGTGKTAAIMEEIRTAVEQKQGGKLLIVPEQYSHEAERELCRVCGDSLSLYAEALSFTALARKLASQLGGAAAPYLDKGGRLLCMALALADVGSRLKVYSAARRKAELQASLLSALDELKSACIDSAALLSAAEEYRDSLGDKLEDLALILEAYDAVVANGHADPADRLSVLAGQIPASDFGPKTHIYVDGFIDFTRQEMQVLEALLKKGAELTVCLTLDSLQGDNEVYELSRRAARHLISAAKELGIETRLVSSSGKSTRAPGLSFFADNIFSYSSESFEGDCSCMELYAADNMELECELAAAKAIELVRDRDYRWRDIALAIRGFNDYRACLESVFSHYGVPLFVARRSDLSAKPLPALINIAYELHENGWDTDDVISYMRTGLTGLERSECDTLENYIFKWQLRAGAWQRSDDWHQHPDGYGNDYDDEAKTRLEEINSLRRRLSAPLLHFHRAAEAADTALGQARALTSFFEELQLPRLLEKRALELRAAGKELAAQEYFQLWELIVSALEQCAAILGDTAMDMQEFGKLFAMMLSRYDIGSIPVSLDRVSAGDFDRMRRRSIKALIVLGAGDDRLPGTDEGAGLFSEDERQRLMEAGIDLGAAGDGELWREFSLIYNCLSLPSQRLIMSYPCSSADGSLLRPSFVFNRASALLKLHAEPAQPHKLRTSAPAPALTLAANAVSGGSGVERAAAEYFRSRQPQRFAALCAAANISRGRLSPRAVESLYGRKLRLSASRIDKFASCKFAYFCQYGLKAKPYEPAGFTPPEIGSFMHYVLEHTARDVHGLGGFSAVSDEKLRQLCDKYIEEYVSSELNDFQEKSSRFVYLFKRLCKDVYQVVSDMAAELRRSDFEPLDFELDFGRAEEFPPVALGDGESSMTLTGIADRVDGWLHEGKLYLRVVDYKTGRKKFSLSDVCCGMGLQMLLYLFALAEKGQSRYGHEIVPAGIMYVPARNAIVSLTSNVDDGSASEKRQEEARRSGLVLNDDALLEAWEHGEDKLYIPVKSKNGRLSAESLASAEQLGQLYSHIRRCLEDMAGELRRGSISADPYYRSQQENACLNCDYFDACHFSDGQNGESCRYWQKYRTEAAWELIKGGEPNG